MISVNPYLNFNGNTEEVFNFYKSVFGGEFLSLIRFKDIPDYGKMPEVDKNKLMHIALPLGNGIDLMASDTLESMGQKHIAGNNFSIALHTESKEEADRLFNALSEGGNVELPINDVPWGAYFGMLNDKFGIKWMVNYAAKK